ncbi:unnamed protein product [Peniophora sp. CBMAI 1063]|nr:unnamed protein product [Peniophora sp. CBMAI 1063]
MRISLIIIDHPRLPFPFVFMPPFLDAVNSLGFVPRWQLVVGYVALFNAVQQSFAREYARGPDIVMPTNTSVLESHTKAYGIWTHASALVCYIAYHMRIKEVYDVALYSYILALCTFFLELSACRRAHIFGPMLGIIVVSGRNREPRVTSKALKWARDIGSRTACTADARFTQAAIAGPVVTRRFARAYQVVLRGDGATVADRSIPFGSSRYRLCSVHCISLRPQMDRCIVVA